MDNMGIAITGVTRLGGMVVEGYIDVVSRIPAGKHLNFGTSGKL